MIILRLQHIYNLFYAWHTGWGYIPALKNFHHICYGTNTLNLKILNDKLITNLEQLFKNTATKTSLHKYHLNKHIKEFTQHIKNHPIILDIGSATSPYKSFFTFKEYISLDIDVQRGGNIDIIGDVSNLPIQGSSVDCIICTEVLEHVKDTENAFRELNRVLKSGGYLILTTPLLIGVHDSIDFYRFTETALRSLLDKYEFEILIFKKRGGIFSSVVSILSQIPYQVFGPYTNKRNYIKFGIFFLFYLSLFPVKKICLMLDKFDKNKNFTLGYDVLAKKK